MSTYNSLSFEKLSLIKSTALKSAIERQYQERHSQQTDGSFGMLMNELGSAPTRSSSEPKKNIDQTGVADNPSNTNWVNTMVTNPWVQSQSTSDIAKTQNQQESVSDGNESSGQIDALNSSSKPTEQSETASSASSATDEASATDHAKTKAASTAQTNDDQGADVDQAALPSNGATNPIDNAAVAGNVAATEASDPAIAGKNTSSIQGQTTDIDEKKANSQQGLTGLDSSIVDVRLKPTAADPAVTAEKTDKANLLTSNNPLGASTSVSGAAESSADTALAGLGQTAQDSLNSYLQNAQDMSTGQIRVTEGNVENQAFKEVLNVSNSQNAAASSAALASANTSPTNTTPIVKMNESVHSAAFPTELSQKIVWMAGRNMSSADIQLNPESLGPLNMKLHIKGNEAQLIMTAHDAQSQQLLAQAIPALKEILSQSGIVTQDIQVRVGPEANGNNAGSEQQMRQNQDQSNQSNRNPSAEDRNMGQLPTIGVSTAPEAGLGTKSSIDLFA